MSAAAREHVIQFNPRPRIERVELLPGSACLVVDDALREPERLVQFASARSAEFRRVDYNYYPGVLLPTPGAISHALNAFFIEHIRPYFPARRVISMHSRLALVTLPPRELHPAQWVCHSDNVNLPLEQSMQASVLYLFPDSGLGGTSFYQPVLSRSETARFFHDASALPAVEFAARYGLEPGYQCDSNRYFRRIGTVAAKWNRLIFYDGGVLHSGDILVPDRLSADPRSGRLTLNGFFTSRRPAA